LTICTDSQITNVRGIPAECTTALVRTCNHHMDDSRIPKQVFYGQLHHGSRRPGRQYKRYKDCLKSTLNRCSVASSELEAVATDRADWRSSCKIVMEKFEARAFGSWSLNGIYTSLVHHPPATLSARSATGCVVHGSGFLPTTSPTHDDETRRVDDSVHEVSINH